MHQVKKYLFRPQPHMVPVAAYIAGMLDADGHIGKHKTQSGHHRLTLTIDNTYAPLIGWLADQTGGIANVKNLACDPNCTKSHVVHQRKDGYRFILRGERGFIVARAIYPYMIEKKVHLKEVILAEHALGKRRWVAQIRREMCTRGWLHEVPI